MHPAIYLRNRWLNSYLHPQCILQETENETATMWATSIISQTSDYILSAKRELIATWPAPNSEAMFSFDCVVLGQCLGPISKSLAIGWASMKHEFHGDLRWLGYSCLTSKSLANIFLACQLITNLECFLKTKLISPLVFCRSNHWIPGSPGTAS